MSFIGGNTVNTVKEGTRLQKERLIKLDSQKDFVVKDGNVYLKLADSPSKISTKA
jgi:hypothetical protein